MTSKIKSTLGWLMGKKKENFKSASFDVSIVESVVNIQLRYIKKYLKIADNLMYCG